LVGVAVAGLYGAGLVSAVLLALAGVELVAAHELQGDLDV